MGKSISAIRFAARAMVSLVVAAVAFAPIAGAQSVREVPTSNRVAGTGISGWNGDFQTAASSTELSGPSYTVFDSHGNQYISDTGNNCIRRIDASNGSISVVAGYEATPSSADTCAAAGLTILPTQGLMARRVWPSILVVIFSSQTADTIASANFLTQPAVLPARISC
jgi:hypothetical protein